MEAENRISIPKRALSKPSFLAIIVALILTWLITVIVSPMLSNMADTRIFAVIMYGPIAIPLALVAMYFAGLSVAKICYSKGLNMPKSLLVMLIINAVTVLLFAVISLVMGPVEACFDVCQEVPMGVIIIGNAVFPTILFLIGYYSVFRYFMWVKKYNLSI